MNAIRTLASPLFGFAVMLLWSLGSVSLSAAELVMFERDGCAWCARWDREVGTIYARTPEGASAPLRRINLDRISVPEEGLKAPVRFTPTFVLLDRGREIARITGYMGEDAFWGLLGKFLASTYKPGI